MNKKWILLILLEMVFIPSGYLQDSDTKADQFEPYALVNINEHVSDVKAILQDHGVRIIKGDIYPRKEFADSNLYATIYAQPNKNDSLYTMGSECHIGLSFYRNRLVHINYFTQLNNEEEVDGMLSILTGLIGQPDEVSNVPLRTKSSDYHEIIDPDKKCIWKGNRCDVEFLYKKNMLQYEIEIIKIETTAYGRYLADRKVIEDQKTLMNLHPPVIFNNLNRLHPKEVYTLIEIVSDWKHISHLEMILPNCTRTSQLYYKRKHDENGIYWGFRDLDKGAYYIYQYELSSQNPVYGKWPDYFKRIFAYCDMDHNIFQIRIEFQNNLLLSCIEPFIYKTEAIMHYKEGKTVGYHDILSTAIITVNHNGDEYPKVESMIISKENIEYLVDVD